MFSDADAAALYDVINPWDPARCPGDRFYRELVMAADSVLDVGCGTGAMLAHARQHGHRGRLTGLDPHRADGTVLRVDRASLRFPGPQTLGIFLAAVGFEIDAQYGDWDRGSITATSNEIVTIARKQP